MPTPILIDGFEHQVVSANSFSGTFNGLWQAITDAAHLTFPAGRTGVCLQIAPAGAACSATKQFNDPTALVASVYFKTSTSGVTITLFQILTPGFSAIPTFTLLSDGKLRATTGSGNVDTALSYNDGAWHRLDLKSDVSANPWTFDWQIDGSSQTQGTTASAADSIRQLRLGTASAHTYTCQWDDLVCSATAGDYPLGIHDVLYGVPTGDGTHNAGTNVIEANGGVDIGVTTAFNLMDEWPTTGADYVQQAATGSGNYAEVTFPDQPGGKTIWGVEGIAALFSSGTTANNGTTRIVDGSNNTLTDIYASDMSETSLHYRRAIITAPAGGWDGAGYQGVKARVGFSTNVATVPRWAALMLQYAVVDSSPGGGSADVFGMMGFFGA